MSDFVVDASGHPVRMLIELQQARCVVRVTEVQLDDGRRLVFTVHVPDARGKLKPYHSISIQASDVPAFQVALRGFGR